MVKDNNIQENIKYLTNISKTMYEINNDDKILIEKLNLLSTEEINKVIDKYSSEKFGPIKFIRLIIAYELKKNKITLNKIEEIKNKVKNKDTEYFKQYNVDDKFFIGLNNLENNKDIFRKHKTNFNLLYKFFVLPNTSNIQIYLNEICDFIVEVLNLTGYVVKLNIFDGPRSNGENSMGIYIYSRRLNDYKYSLQLSIEFRNGNIYSKTIKGSKCKIDYEGKEIKCSNIQECIDFLQQNKEEIIKLNNSLIGKENTKKLDNGANMNNEITQPLNQILYGPPGTGKTYNTIIKAMEIIDSTNKYDNIDDTKYKELKDRFNKLKESGQIEFITFHQSFSYEEFIEGIKPDVENTEKIVYKIENGIFKKIVDDALFNMLNITEQQEQKEKEFDEVLNIFKINHQEGTELNTISSQSKFIIVEYLKDSIRIKPKDGSYIYSVSYEPLQEIYEKDKENNILTAKELVERMDGRFAGLSSYYFAVLDNLKKYTKQIETTNQRTIDFDKSKFLKEYYSGNIKLKENPNKYILIIDEINRGNISKIFGELITLIEEDKRIGNEHELKLTLPYSKKPFGIPNNLYIIGTMNTSDRSIASVDIALRRRFKFIEMMPKNDLVADFGVGFDEIFKELNNKIKILLDRDHQIGHSYFINTKYNNDNKNNNIETLKGIWFSEILPLLNEYFYNDWDKLNLIVPGFITKIIIPENLKEEFENAYEFKTIKDFEKDEDFINALLKEPKEDINEI